MELKKTPYTTEEDVVVRLLNQILHQAIENQASDIHFEPYEKNYRIRYRQDGILYETKSPAYAFASRINTRIKILAQLDIAEKRLPQDGGFKITLTNGLCRDCRVSTCPTPWGEKIVIRLLESDSTKFNLDCLGLNTLQRNILSKAIQSSQGFILITGPTGSGKTQTLYSALNYLNNSRVNIVSAEDPIEIRLTGINQLQINSKAELTFAKALRAFLRQDPDIIMVGEIRDLETAEMAIKAAQTGHLVLSSLHTNSTLETLTRLQNMGIPSYLLAHTLTLIVAQRLVRKLCIYCKQPQNNGNYKAIGCSKCKEGYLGRIALFEFLELTPKIREHLLNQKNSTSLFEVAKEENFITLYEAGLALIKEGLTTFEEILRIKGF